MTLRSYVICSILIGWALAIHGSFIAAVPDPIFASDSVGYAQPAIHLLFGKHFDLDPLRTPMYPMFLYGILKVTSHFLGLLIVQHALALLTGGIVAFLYYRYIWKSYVGATIVFFMSAALPVPAIYAHYVLTENLYTFFLITAVFLMLLSHETNSKQYWALTGIAVALAILTRPVGRALLAILLVAPLLESNKRPALRSWLCGIGSAAGILMMAALWNYTHQGFFGLDRFGSIALFANTAGGLNLDQIEDKQVQELLRPYYMKHVVGTPDWIFLTPDSPLQKLHRLYPPEQLNKTLQHLAFKSICNNPKYFLRNRYFLTMTFLRDYTEVPLWYIIPETSYYVYQGLNIYRHMVESDPSAWGLLRYGPREAEAYFADLTFIPTGRPSGHLPFVPHSKSDLAYHYNKVLLWWTPLKPLIDHMRWLSILSFASGLILMSKKYLRYPVAIMYLIIVFHAVLSTLSPAMDSRYAVPILPFYDILLIGGIQYAGAKFFKW